MPKILSFNRNQPGDPDFAFQCPGCNQLHGLWTTTKNPVTGAQWIFNGDILKPTVSPSVVVKGGGGSYICHSVVKEGKIHFLSDCTHDLKNQEIELPEVDE